MAGSSKLVDFYKLEVVPVIMASAPSILPEFDFKWGREGWVVGPGASQAVLDYFGVRADRIALSKLRPGLFVIAGEKGLSFQLHAWVLGRATPPKGEDYTKAVLELAKLARVDASSVDGSKKLTAEDRAEIDARRDRLAKESKELEKERNAQKKREDQEAVKAAMNFLVRAKKHTDEHGQKLAVDYFVRRGHKLGQGELGKLPESVLCVADAGIGPSGTGAIVFPTINEHGKPTGLQRVFVDSMGRKMVVCIKDKDVGKATLGKPFGSRCTLGDGYKDGVCIIVEGGETGVAVNTATGYTVECGISSGGVEQIKLSAADIKAERIKVIIVAGDLDKSGTGQKTTAIAGDRLRAMYGIPVVELLPSQAMVPGLVGDDEMPLNGAKSVDFDDVLKAIGVEKMQYVFDDAIKLATVLLQHAPKSAEEEQREEVIEDEDEDDGFKQEPTPRLLMPKNDLDCAHEYLLSRHLPDRAGSTTMLKMSSRMYRWEPGAWIELGEPKVLDGDIRRWARPYKIRKQFGKTKPDRWIFPYANIGKNQVSAIRDAVADEVEVIIGREDFRTQFWIVPTITRDGKFDIGTPSWSRRIENHVKAGKPNPEMVLSITNGLIDLDEWVEHHDLTPIPHTPDFFTLSKIEIELPVDEIKAILNGKKFDGNTGIEGVRALARSMCPLWMDFLTMSFMDEDDDQAAPVTIREYHKFLGYAYTEDLSLQQGNMAIMHGPSGGGKSVGTNVFIKVIGIKNTVSSHLHKLGDPFHLGTWLRKKLAAFSDLDIGPRTDKSVALEFLKMILTGDPLSVNQKYRDELPSHVLKTRIIANVNQMPKLPDTANAMLRRMIVFDWKRSVPKDKRDPDLEAKLSTPESLAGILLLGLVGLIDLKTDGGFIQPKWSMGPIERFADQGSDYPDFIEQCLEITDNKALSDGDYEGDFITHEDLYDARCGYLASVGTKHLPKRADMLAEIYPILTAHEWNSPTACQVQLKGEMSAIGWRGIKLKPMGQALAQKHRGAQEKASDDTQGMGNDFLTTTT